MFDAKQESVSRRGFLGFAGVAAAGLAGATALSGCSPRTSGGKDSKSGEVAGINGVSGHEREGLPSFLIAPEPITDISETLDYDVVVVGAGSAGIPAALSACEAGAKVALLQKESTAISQGNTASGIITDKSNPAAAAALAQLLVKESAYRADPALIQVWIDNGGEAVKWVLDKVAAAGGSVIDQGNNQQSKASNEVNGYEGLNYVTSYMGPKPYSNGDGMKVLAQVAEEAGVDIYYSTPAEQLAKNEDGAVSGVIAEGENVYMQFNAAKGVIIATGDYQNDEEMSNYYLPDLRYFGRKQSNKTGDGHKMIVWAGGKITNIVHTKMMHDFDAGPMWNVPFLAVKTASGKRFMNEKIDMAMVCNYLTSEADAGRYCQVFDSKYEQIVPEWKGVGKFVSAEDMRVYMPEEEVERKGVLEGFINTWKADTLEELAEKLGIEDTKTFVSEVEAYNELCAAGSDTAFGKEAQYMIPVDTPPYYGISRTIRLSAICSGVDVDSNHQCLNDAGEPIKGLYAVGNCSGGFYGGVDYPLTVGGLSIGRCYMEGYVTGKLVASL